MVQEVHMILQEQGPKPSTKEEQVVVQGKNEQNAQEQKCPAGTGIAGVLAERVVIAFTLS
jgi:hypothetical protein